MRCRTTPARTHRTDQRRGLEASIIADSLTTSGRQLAGIALCAVAVVPLVMYGNPAVALLCGAAISLTLGRQPVVGGSSVGKYCLQAAIILLGFRLDLHTVWQLSASYTWGVAAYVLSALALGTLLGWLLKVEANSSKLITAGTAICGGTAIATLSPILGAKPHQTGMALAIVFLLNAFALFTFPTIGHYFDMSQLQFGLWTALAIHDTSSVVATAAIYGQEAADVATTIKLGRTLWLIPLSFAVSLMAHSGGARLRIPGFIVLFLAATATGSFLPVPAGLTAFAGHLSKILLVVALFLVGTDLTRGTLRQIRGVVVWQAVGLWLIVVPLTLAAIMLLV